jgi:lactate dehydrogenase-like 2-hydroxyacid dehydrogenase
LGLIGEIEGDRFSKLVDLPAARRAGVVIVDTTNASSGPVAEWALALALVGCASMPVSATSSAEGR